MGNRAEALRVFGCCERLQEELGASPITETQSLFPELFEAAVTSVEQSPADLRIFSPHVFGLRRGLLMLNDFKFAIRRLFKTPGFTVSAVIVLALGIGVNTAVFVVVHTLLLAPPPFSKPA